MIKNTLDIEVLQQMVIDYSNKKDYFLKSISEGHHSSNKLKDAVALIESRMLILQRFIDQ